MNSRPAPVGPASAPALVPRSGAQRIATELACRGVRSLYGVPGGDCSLDLIQAAEEAGIRFVLARTENSAAMMAAAEARSTGGLGAVLSTRGPGLANGVNGVACAMLDRCPLVFISDGYEDEQAYVSHQRFDQERVLQPVTKGSLRVSSPGAVLAVGGLLDLALDRPQGPVYLEVTGKGVREQSVAFSDPPLPPAGPQPCPPVAAPGLDRVLQAMRAASRPVLVVGLLAREPGVAEAFRALSAAWRVPVFATYMAKGVLPDSDSRMMGHFMVGAAEAPTLLAADLIVTFGLDPIELLPKRWPYPAPVIELTTQAFDRLHVMPTDRLTGDLAEIARKLAADVAPGAWAADECERIRAHMRRSASVGIDVAGSPTHLARLATSLLPPRARVTVDAGAHMLPVMAFRDSEAPGDTLISRGLATMAYALPSAIGLAMADPSRPVVAFTGDGGLMMCIAELATAVQYGCRLAVVVFNDASIAMIGVKQKQRGLPRQGMDYSRARFAAVAEGFGAAGFELDDPVDAASVLTRAFDHPGVSLVDVRVDPSSYDALLGSLRG
jgi:acetolactate synthase-1/2/3 large subunit